MKNRQGAAAENIATAPCRFKKPSFIKAQFPLQYNSPGKGVHHRTQHR